jgi:predicted ArsR family transcriptional regulator
MLMSAKKPLLTLQEIADQLGLHKNTVRNKMKKYEFLLQKGTRKHFYDENEQKLIYEACGVKTAEISTF